MTSKQLYDADRALTRAWDALFDAFKAHGRAEHCKTEAAAKLAEFRRRECSERAYLRACDTRAKSNMRERSLTSKARAAFWTAWCTCVTSGLNPDSYWEAMDRDFRAVLPWWSIDELIA